LSFLVLVVSTLLAIAMPPPKSRTQFRQFNELKNWPYDWETTDRTLDPRLLEEHGAFMLNRALNTRSLVAFVGSGVSSVYGRVSWRDLTVQHMESLREFLDKGKDQAPAEVFDHKPTLDHLLSQARGGENHALMLGLQVCERIWSASASDSKFLKSLVGHFGLSDSSKPNPQPQPDDGQKLFRQWMKAETYDELAHVRRVIHGNIWRGDDGAEQPHQAQTDAEWGEQLRQAHEWLFKSAELTRFRTSPRKYLPLFARPTFKALAEVLQGPWSATANAGSRNAVELARYVVGCTLESGFRSAGEQDPAYLQPADYFLLGLVLDLVRWAARNDGETPGLKKGVFEALKRVLAPSGPAALPAHHRSTIIDPQRDPLHQLFFDLGIKRFVTTNYDLEIERLMDDLAFVGPRPDSLGRLDDHDVERVAPLGGRARDIDLTAKTAVDLIDFAANESPHDLTVVHLHGRSTDNSELVVTERDYQARYMRDDDGGQAMIREGLNVLFGGNPILFVGLGLTEDDLMRPLRQFVSTEFKRNRTLVALVPPTADEDSRSARKMELYARYGVSVIYFGRWTDAPDAPAEEAQHYWLQWIYQDAKEMVTALSALDAAAPSRSEYRRLRDQLAGLFAGGKSGDRLRETFYRAAAGASIESDGQPCDIRLPVKVLIRLRAFVVEWLDSRAGSPQTAEPRELSRLLFKDVVRLAIERATTAVMSAALSAKLAGVVSGWQKWWTDWQKWPGDRTEFVGYSNPLASDPPGATPSAVETWCRYHTEDAAAVRWTEGDRDDDHGFGFFLRSIAHPAPAGRRIFALMSARGSGKGHFFSTLTLHASRMLRESPAGYKRSFCATFSYSCEIASVWDALIMFLAQAAEDAEGRTREERKKPFEVLQRWAEQRGLKLDEMGRLERLRTALQSLVPPPRDGEPAEGGGVQSPGRLLVAFSTVDVLIQPDGYPKNAEIRAIFDILLDDAAAGVPIDLIFVGRDDRLPLYFCKRPDLGGEIQRQRREACRLVEFNTLFPAQSAGARQDDALHAARRETIATLDARGITRPDGDALRQPLAADDAGRPVAPARGRPPRDAFIHVIQPADPRTHLTDFQSVQADLPGTADPASGGTAGSAAFDKVIERLRAYFGNNRFLFTVVLRAVEEIRGRITIDGAAGSDAGRQVNAFVDEIVHVASVSETGRDDRILGLVLDRYANDPRAPLGAEDSRLDEAIIRHLAVIATPIEADVLGSCPYIKQIVREVLVKDPDVPPSGLGVDLWCDHLVGRALKVLVRRGLVFRLRNRPGKGQNRPRFAVHRFIQRYVYRRLSAQAAEPTEANFFTISLYASQASDLPTLSASAYRFVDELLDHLILYPRRVPPVFRSKGLRARCLRAAIAVTRTLFPLGAVSRFADLPGLGRPSAPECGHVEHRRLAVRWLLRAATELNDESEAPETPAQAEAYATEAFLSAIEARLKSDLDPFESKTAPLDGPQWKQLAKEINSLQEHVLSAMGALFAIADRPPAPGPHGATSKDDDETHVILGILTALVQTTITELERRSGHGVAVLKEFGGQLEDLERSRHQPSPGQPAATNAARVERGPGAIAADAGARADAIAKPLADASGITAIRTMIRQLVDACAELPSASPRDKATRLQEIAKSAGASDWPPLYRDEIMWLYNECGVFSLAQGNVHDAHALFGRALSQGKRIEGRHGGPMRRRILLNDGLAALHRGRLNEARRDFQEAMDAHEDPTIRYAAMGYLGSCHHLGAELERAEQLYAEALDHLLAIPRLRAASIVACNFGNLHWHLERVPDAERMYEKSVRLAVAAGSVDLAHLHRVAQTRILRQDPADTASLREARRYLDDAEAYANQMDLPYPLADVLNAHAEIQLLHKDAKAAGIYATRALRIARLSGLRLRKLAFLEGMTRIYRERGQAEAASRLLERIMQSARDIGYLLLAERAQRERSMMLARQ
jgi:tetratricopeptide (TPR) repeat protein